MSTQSKNQPVVQLLNKGTDVDFLTMFRTTVHAILAPLASLKLTVCLLSLAVFAIWVITLEQTRAGIGTVKNRHFPDLFVHIPFQTFFPPAWFAKLQNIPGGFYMPSGTLLLIMMIVNLLAAHLVRMRVSATGGRLGLGIVGLVIGLVFTWAVIYFDPGLSTQATSKFYRGMWYLMQVGLLGLVVGSITAIVTLGSNRRIEQVVLATFAFLSMCVLIFVFVMGDKAFISDSAMRILWQLLQATVAALLLLAGCIMVFKRKGGMVLIHFGIGMLMFNELYVTMTNVEQRMSLNEGQSSSTTMDIRNTELMVMHENAEGKHEIVTLPRDKFLKEQTVSHRSLPFNIECLEYFPNSDLKNVVPGSENPATHGIGLFNYPQELAVSDGVSSNQSTDVASGYFRFISKEGDKPLGIYMASQEAYLEGVYDKIECDGETYYIGLRFKEYYKPYTIAMEDVERELYVGTEIPQSFSSEFTLTDHKLGQSSQKRVWMNNPLRFNDETFYQSGYMDLGTTERTTLQIVKNGGWMIPYVACMIVVVGLVAQFGATLLKFLEKAQAKEKPFTATIVTSGSKEIIEKKNARHKWAWIPLALVAVIGVWIAMTAKKSVNPEIVKNEMRIDLWGDMPVTHGGRIQPLESVARSTVLQLAKREEVRYPVDEEGNELSSADYIELYGEPTLEKSDEATGEAAAQKDVGSEVEIEPVIPTVKRPAIRWVADMVYETNGYEHVQIFRVEDLEVAAALELPEHRKGLKYTMAEVNLAKPELRRLVDEASETVAQVTEIAEILERDPSVSDEELAQMLGVEVERVIELRKLDPQNPLTTLQKRLRDLLEKLNQVYGLRYSLQNLVIDEDILERLHTASNVSKNTVPRSLHVSGREWIPLSVATAQVWLDEFANARGVGNLSVLSRELTQAQLGMPARAEIVFRQLERDPDFQKLLLSQETPPQTPEDVKALMAQNSDMMSKVLEKAERIADKNIADFFAAAPVAQELEEQFKSIVKVIYSNSVKMTGFDTETYERLMELQPAYLEDDAEKFNSTLETYLASINKTPPQGMRGYGMAAEKFYNFFSPFYLAITVYLFAIFFTLIGWIGFPSMRRAGFWVIGLGLLIHATGLIFRIVISGRPPVTNLYSSFLFVSAGSVCVMMVVERMTKLGIGNVLAGIFGSWALIWAQGIAIKSGDTFAVLQAVLDTQFWLTTHVICISLGYSATVAAGLLGIAFLIASILVPVFNKETRRTFGKIIYGIVCFALLLSFFGTVLGGLWGDDSWGRFWGWDPKENGALMIVFWNAILLHARWGGMIKERGLAGLSVLGIVITLWSWEGVNQLGVGLHSYGFNEGKLILVIQLAAGMIFLASLALIPQKFWLSVRRENQNG